MQEMKKITIKDFLTEYNKRPEQTKEKYLKDNLIITSYLPFIKKNALAEKIVEISTYIFEDYTKEDGTIGRKNSGKIKVNSVAQYLLFCRLIIENYTNLIVETDGFFEEYDLLKKCGLLDKLMIGADNTPSIIPIDEIAELQAIIDMKTKDEIFNKTEVHNYINSLLERFGDIINVLAKPIINKAIEQIDNNQDYEKK